MPNEELNLFRGAVILANHKTRFTKGHPVAADQVRREDMAPHFFDRGSGPPSGVLLGLLIGWKAFNKSLSIGVLVPPQIHYKDSPLSLIRNKTH